MKAFVNNAWIDVPGEHVLTPLQKYQTGLIVTEDEYYAAIEEYRAWLSTDPYTHGDLIDWCVWDEFPERDYQQYLDEWEA